MRRMAPRTALMVPGVQRPDVTFRDDTVGWSKSVTAAGTSGRRGASHSRIWNSSARTGATRGGCR